ncbi:ThiF family adenylyltransferase [Streptomyces sp. ATexAB-D23]|uniref:ThiF family adenylyltransferase n=1 Tax=unclassified Streptomyces TaxID=2593676 RepID=UPI00047587DE|nr:ThiF family adenylyltransferase [Streptomyces sp. ATexAB-D23]MYY02003.1 ThiF family adenylyltransferase [Streptomyces sp. SID4913]
MHPMLKPALRRAWRGRDTVQFGVTPAHAVKVGPMDIATGCFMELLDGTRGMPLLREEARAMDLSERHVDALVMRLMDAGLVDDVRAGGPEADALRKRPDVLERHRPDLASLSVVHPEPGAAMRRLAARRSTRVQVRGAGRVGAAIAAVLSGAGVGRVEVLDGGCAEPGDVSPGGLPASAVGERRDMAARQLVRRSAPGPAPRAPGAAGTGPAGREPGLSLIVVAPRDGLSGYVPDPGTAEPWISSGTPHLYAGVMEATGFVGPLVLPGGTACAGCLRLNQRDRDPQWPRMLAQWQSGRRGAVQACDLGLATAVAGLAAAHALAFLDGELPASTGSRWEAALPLLDWRSERIGAHLDCSCGAAGHTEGVRASVAGRAHDTMAG